METKFPLVSLKRVIRYRKEFIRINDFEMYKRCRVQLHAKGIVVRDIVAGSEIKTKNQQICRVGDLLVAEIDAKVGGFGVVPKDLDGAIVSSHYFLFDIDEKVLDRRFLDFFIQTPTFSDQVLAKGSTNYAAIRPDDVLEYVIPLPSLNEQQRIVVRTEEMVKKIFEANDLRHQGMKQAEAFLESELDQLVGDPYAHKSGRLGLDCFKQLNEVITDVADGPHKTPIYVDEGVPFITVSNITSGRVDFSGSRYVTPKDHQVFKKRARAENGDVLISKDGTIGIPCFVDTDREFSFFVTVALIKPNRSLLDGQFLTWILRAPCLKQRMQKQTRGDMIRHLVLREIRHLIVPVPSLDEQQRIVRHLDNLQGKVNALKDLQMKTAAELDGLLPSFLDKAFKGNL